jgi:hypothetical protein
MNPTPRLTLRAAALFAALAPFPFAVAQDKPASAQDAPAAAAPAPPAAPVAPAAAAPAPAPITAPPAAPAKTGPTITPYGIVLLSSFFDSGPFQNKDNANVVKVPVAADKGGTFIASARGTRIGTRLDGLDAGVIRAKLSGVIEFDFKGGHFATNSAGWNAFAPRVRLAFLKADWRLAGGVLSLVGGQDWGVLLNVNPNSVAYSVDPVFVASGNLYRRTPQVKLNWELKGDVFGLTATAAALSPADADTNGVVAASAVDTGVGNKSRQPDLEGRLALSAKAGAAFSGTVGVGYHVGKRRYFLGTTAAPITDDVTSTLLGVDADVSITPYLQLKGEFYDGEAAEDGYSGSFPGSFPSNPVPNATPSTVFSVAGVPTQGWWAQATLKPFAFLWLAGGYGTASATRSTLATTAPTGGTSPRYESEQIHGAVMLVASKALRFGVEAAKTTSKYVVEGSQEATQLSFATQLFF